MAGEIIIAITSPEGCDTHRARVMGTKCIATCTMGAKQAAEAVAEKFVKSTILKGKKWHLVNLPDREYQLVVEGDAPSEPAETGKTSAAIEGNRGQSTDIDRDQEPAVFSFGGLQFSIPSTLDGVMAAIGEAELAGRRLALEVVIYVAHVHDTYYKDNAKAWEKVMEERFGYKRRFCFTCVKVAKLLVRQCRTLHPEQVKGLLGTGVQNLEYLSQIPDHLMPVFLKKHPKPETMDRNSIKTLAKCYATGKTAKEIEAAEDAIAEAKANRANDTTKGTKGTKNPQAAIKTLVSLSASQTDMNKASQDTDPMAAFRAGFTAINLALLHLECGGAALSRAQFDSTLKLATDLVDELGKHQPQEA